MFHTRQTRIAQILNILGTLLSSAVFSAMVLAILLLG